MAASVIAVFWLLAIVVFGIAEHLIEPDTFNTIWLGMWWATQTVDHGRLRRRRPRRGGGPGSSPPC